MHREGGFAVVQGERRNLVCGRGGGDGFGIYFGGRVAQSGQRLGVGGLKERGIARTSPGFGAWYLEGGCLLQ